MSERRKREKAIEITKGAFFLSMFFVVILVVALYYAFEKIIPSYPLTEQSCTSPLANGLTFLVKEEEKVKIMGCVNGEAIDMTAQLKGEPGPQGEKGEQGEPGERGPIGPKVVVEDKVAPVANHTKLANGSVDVEYIEVLGKKIKVQKKLKN